MNDTMKRPLIEMVEICKGFGGKVALDHASLALMEGEVLGLVGDNGAGKSTMLKILSGALHKDAGEIFVNGKKTRISSPRDARSLGIEMVYQDLGLCGSMNVWENVFLGRYLTKSFCRTWISVLDKRRMASETRLALTELDIDLRRLHEPIRNLSGGEQQAVAMCRSLVSRPKVVLLDEPTASMAVRGKEKILKKVVGLKQGGCSAIMVTHNLPEIFQVADRVLVMKEGRSIWCGALCGMDQDDLAGLMFGTKSGSAR